MYDDVVFDVHYMSATRSTRLRHMPARRYHYHAYVIKDNVFHLTTKLYLKWL